MWIARLSWVFSSGCDAAPSAPAAVDRADVHGQAAAAAPVVVDVGQDALAAWTSWYGGSRGAPDLAAAGDADGDGVADWAIAGHAPAVDSPYPVDDEGWLVASDAPSGRIADVGRLVASGDDVPRILGGPRDDDGDGRSEVIAETELGLQRLTLDPGGAGWDTLGEVALLAEYSHVRAFGRDFTGDGQGDVALFDQVFYGPIVGRNTDRDGVPLPITSASNRLAGVGDMDGDGIDDLVVLHETIQLADLAGAPAAPSFGPGQIEGSDYGAPVGDLDGDGYADLALFGGWVDNRTYIVAGPFPTVAIDLASASVADLPGRSLIDDGEAAPVGDVDGDGADDVAFAWWDAWYGRVAMAHGPLAGAIDPATLPQWRGETPYDGFGYGIAAQDVDGDGVYELAVAAGQWGHGSLPPQGALYLLEPL